MSPLSREEIQFSDAELKHLLYLIDENKRIGWYYGSKAQYWTRSYRIEAKLTIALHPKAEGDL